MTKKYKHPKLSAIQLEKARLKNLSDAQMAVIKDDIAWVKQEYSPLEILNKAAKKVVPEPVRHSSAVNSPINFIAEKIFGKKADVVDEGSDKGKGNQLRNIALGVAEGLATYLVTRYIRRKIF